MQTPSTRKLFTFRHWGAVSFTLIVLSLVSCSKGEEATTQAPAKNLRFTAAQSREVPIYYEFIGETKGAVDAEIRARVAGEITKIHFEEGKEVKEGDLLYSIDQAPFLANLAKAKAGLSQANTMYTEAAANLKRIKPLAEMNAVSKRDLDVAISRDGTAAGSVEAAQAGVETAEIELSYTRIHSPVSGVIGISKAKVGELVGTAPNPVILNTVSQLDPIHVSFSVNEKDYLYFAKMAQKQKEDGEEPTKRALELVLADGSQHSQKGKVVSVDRGVDAKTGSMTVEAAFRNPGNVLRPGLFAKIRTIGETLKEAVVIPKAAIREMQGKSFVFVLAKNDAGEEIVQQREVAVAQVLGAEQVISDHLKVGEHIAVEAVQQLRSGMLVKPVLNAEEK